jgi:3-hydroxyacyl-CoA dehydrogenase
MAATSVPAFTKRFKVKVTMVAPHPGADFAQGTVDVVLVDQETLAGLIDEKRVDDTLEGPTGRGDLRDLRWIGDHLYAAGMRRIFPTLCNDADVPQVMQKLESENAMGLASGHGFYSYTDAQAKQWAQLLREQTWATRKQQEQLP